jgi:hypothetical protein
MVIANRLRDGLVVFLDQHGRWVRSIDAGGLADDAAQGEHMMEIARQAEAANEVIDPQLIEVSETGGVRQPVLFREAIRAVGPTTGN